MCGTHGGIGGCDNWHPMSHITTIDLLISAIYKPECDEAADFRVPDGMLHIGGS
jgi:hypothetical protein